MITKLKIAVNKSGYKQNWIAKKIGIDDATLSKYLNGERKIPQKIADKIESIIRK